MFGKQTQEQPHFVHEFRVGEQLVSFNKDKADSDAGAVKLDSTCGHIVQTPEVAEKFRQLRQRLAPFADNWFFTSQPFEMLLRCPECNKVRSIAITTRTAPEVVAANAKANLANAQDQAVFEAEFSAKSPAVIAELHRLGFYIPDEEIVNVAVAAYIVAKKLEGSA